MHLLCFITHAPKQFKIILGFLFILVSTKGNEFINLFYAEFLTYLIFFFQN